LAIHPCPRGSPVRRYARSGRPRERIGEKFSSILPTWVATRKQKQKFRLFFEIAPKSAKKVTIGEEISSILDRNAFFDKIEEIASFVPTPPFRTRDRPRKSEAARIACGPLRPSPA
jgi:hypothetical protein